MPIGSNLLSTVRINQVMAAIQDVRELPNELVWLRRTPAIDAVDGEIMARFVGRVQIADLVADDSQAVTYTSGKMTFETTTVPNIKHGQQLTQTQINELVALQTQGADVGLYANYEQNIIDGLLLGIRQRQEALILAMLCDSFSYDRLGIKMSGVTWGMPADLKVTPSVAWTDATNGTPVTDILTLKRLAQVRYGIMFDRLSMSLAAFLYMIATTEFQNRARTFLAPNVSYVNIATQNTDYMKLLAQSVLGVAEIELYDSRFWSQDSTGALTSAPYLPINKVIFSARANDNNPRVWDWASGIVTETLVGSLMRSSMVGRFPAAQRGPVAYATVAEDLNPPNITYWGVTRGFPRKHLLQMNAVLTVGSFTDPIPVGEPF
jgi:hypothetical protein